MKTPTSHSTVIIIDKGGKPFSKIITLDVSGSIFKARKDTLAISPWFQALFSRRDEADTQGDGSYFIDADPAPFKHLLNFMRRPNKFPLFWTKQNGFDIALYSKLESEADYFLLHDLRDWIREKKYMYAIRLVQDIIVNDESWALENKHDIPGAVSAETYIIGQSTSSQSTSSQSTSDQSTSGQGSSGQKICSAFVYFELEEEVCVNAKKEEKQGTNGK